MKLPRDEYQITERPPDPPAMRPAGCLRTTGEVTFEPIAPERAHREGDQPLPKAGKHDVLDELAATVPPALAARRTIGIRRYGRPLETWNGRDVHQDLDDELLDALAYARQAKLERRDLEAELVRAREDLDKARADLDSHVKALDARIETLRAERDDALRGLDTAKATFARAQADLMAQVSALRDERDALRRVVD